MSSNKFESLDEKIRDAYEIEVMEKPSCMHIKEQELKVKIEVGSLLLLQELS